MTIVFRPERNASVTDGRSFGAQADDQHEAQLLGSGMRIVCSPWEGIYLEQAYSFHSGFSEGRVAAA